MNQRVCQSNIQLCRPLTSWRFFFSCKRWTGSSGMMQQAMMMLMMLIARCGHDVVQALCGGNYIIGVNEHASSHGSLSLLSHSCDRLHLRTR